MRTFTRTSLVAAAAFGACGDAGRPAAAPIAAPLGPTVHRADVMDLRGEILAEENDDVINVAPIFFDDPDGGFLVADLKESQVRLYRRDGSLRAAVGGAGDGPGEFHSPVMVHRLPDGRLVAGDFSNARLTVLSAEADSVLDTQAPPLFPLYNALPLSSERLLLAGRLPGAQRPPLLHVWNLGSEMIESSFFSVPVPLELSNTALSLGFVGLDRRGDTVFATFSLTDTVYAFNLGESTPRLIDRTPVPIRGFSVVPPERDVSASVEARQRWLSRLTPIQAVHALPSSFLVLFGERRGPENLWHWTHFARDGAPLFELRDGGQILTTRGDTVFFLDPEAMVPNRWRFGVLKRR